MSTHHPANGPRPAFRPAPWVGAVGVALYAAGRVVRALEAPDGLRVLDAIFAVLLATSAVAVVSTARGLAIPVERPRLIVVLVTIFALMEVVDAFAQPSTVQLLRAIGSGLLAAALAPLWSRHAQAATELR